jgi:hypothetical protein
MAAYILEGFLAEQEADERSMPVAGGEGQQREPLRITIVDKDASVDHNLRARGLPWRRERLDESGDSGKDVHQFLRHLRPRQDRAWLCQELNMEVIGHQHLALSGLYSCFHFWQPISRQSYCHVPHYAGIEMASIWCRDGGLPVPVPDRGLGG